MQNLLSKITPETKNPCYWLCCNICDTDADNDSTCIAVHFSKRILGSAVIEGFGTRCCDRMDLLTQGPISSRSL